MRNKIGDMLIDALTKSGLSQTQLSSRTGYSRPLINRIISGDRNITMPVAFKIQEFLPAFNARKAMLMVMDKYEKDITNRMKNK